MRVSLEIDKSLVIDGRAFTLVGIGKTRILFDVEPLAANDHPVAYADEETTRRLVAEDMQSDLWRPTP